VIQIAKILPASFAVSMLDNAAAGTVRRARIIRFHLTARFGENEEFAAGRFAGASAVAGTRVNYP